ncbi:hypothetical protein M8312_06855 [Sphingomonas sp. KRR8]|uniref:phage fiber-tail adaptor protein n=1 Tax=Sphingomonas sp. KRR8 TaxID=2942996 RepID=UPI002021D8BF|nr:hypothetical protein [Sphingomonas sp. KRR8]URD62216.1 hypothetical protein M8312_06855 [Sphingomonas sp. KRR8]
MSLMLKDPSAVLDYAIDWGRQYLDGDTLVASEWSTSRTDLEVASSSFDDRISQVKLRGGIAGKVYRVSNHVTTSAGREDSRSLVLRVEVR